MISQEGFVLCKGEIEMSYFNNFTYKLVEPGFRDIDILINSANIQPPHFTL